MAGRADPKTWTCRRLRDGVRCGYRNPTIKRNCVRCGLPRQRRMTGKRRGELLLEASRHLYDELLELQGGVCAGCLKPPSDSRRLDLDHDHGKVKIRGLLCPWCNKFLRAGATPAKLRALADYLEHPPAERLGRAA